jgi:GTPase SAR1 family protein
VPKTTILRDGVRVITEWAPSSPPNFQPDAIKSSLDSTIFVSDTAPYGWIHIFSSGLGHHLNSLYYLRIEVSRIFIYIPSGNLYTDPLNLSEIPHLALVGPPGIGKTTLALRYNDSLSVTEKRKLIDLDDDKLTRQTFEAVCNSITETDYKIKITKYSGPIRQMEIFPFLPELVLPHTNYKVVSVSYYGFFFIVTVAGNFNGELTKTGFVIRDPSAIIEVSTDISFSYNSLKVPKRGFYLSDITRMLLVKHNDAAERYLSPFLKKYPKTLITSNVISNIPKQPGVIPVYINEIFGNPSLDGLRTDNGLSNSLDITTISPVTPLSGLLYLMGLPVSASLNNLPLRKLRAELLFTIPTIMVYDKNILPITASALGLSPLYTYYIDRVPVEENPGHVYYRTVDTYSWKPISQAPFTAPSGVHVDQLIAFIERLINTYPKHTKNLKTNLDIAKKT